MESLAALLEYDTTEEVQPEPKPKERRRRLSTPVGKKMQARLAEEARQQMIRQRQELLNKTKKRVQDEWDANRDKAMIFGGEFLGRIRHLKFTYEKVSEIERNWIEYLRELRKLTEWHQYITCDRLPTPWSLPEINSYLFKWAEINPCDQMSQCISKTEEVMKLLDGVEEVIIDNSMTPEYIHQVKEIRNEIRDLLQDNIDRATYNLFSRIETDMIPINVTTSKYTAKSEYFVMSLWAELFTPIPSSREKDTRQPLKVTFDQTGVTAILPVGLLDIHKVIRTMWLDYDHWSDRCPSYDCPTLPAYYNESLFELFMSEYELKQEIINYRFEQEKLKKKKISHLPPDPTISQEILAWDGEPQRELSEEVFFIEWEEEDGLGRREKAALKDFEVNLRERSFVGHLLLLEIFHLPPQPKYLRFKHSVTLREEPQKLHLVDYYVKYPSFELEDVEEDEEEEEELTEQELLIKEIDLEEEMQKLVTIQLKPCKTVLWFEPPKVANWDPIKKYWSTEDVHDVTYNDEDGSITFKTGRLGLMGLHVSRFCSFPYQDWTFEACKGGGAKLYLKTAQTELSFKIREREVCLETMGGAPAQALESVLGTYLSPSKLMKAMKKAGLDVFPPPDAAFYVENVRSKNFVIENHIYQIWGIFCESFRFKFSKFNQVAKRSSIVFQAQEIYENHQVDFCLIHAAMSLCYILEITEDCEQYFSDRAKHSEKYVDLYSLFSNNCTRNAKRTSDTTSFLLIQTVKEFLALVRPISFTFI